MSASSSNCAATSAFAGRLGHPPAMIRPCARPSACRRTTSARTSSRCCARSAACCPTARACSWSTTARPTAPGQLADELAAELDFVDVLHRPRKEGPRARVPRRRSGSALADGAELILEMDCDFSHDPHDVPRLLAAAEDADLVLGSRYVAGGGVENWGVVPALRLVGRLALRARAARRRRPRPHRRLQVLPPRGAGGDRPRRRSRRSATRSRSRRRIARSAPGFRVAEMPITFADREAGARR